MPPGLHRVSRQFILGLLLSGLIAGGAHAANTADLTRQQAEARLQQKQARDQQAKLRERITRLQKQIESQESSREDAALALRKSESAISRINRRLDELNAQTLAAEEALDDLSHQIGQQETTLSHSRDQLADQLRARYASGLSPWTALLSGNDPQDIARDLSYLSYISQAQADAIHGVQTALEKLSHLQQQQAIRREELQQLASETQLQKQELELQREERQKVLARISQELAQQRTEAQTLERNETRLSRLINGLDEEIERLAEEARRAEEKRRAEEARRLEEARRKAEARKREIEAQRLAAEAAERAAREAQKRAQREQDAQRAREAREQVERAREQARAAEQAAQEPAVVPSRSEPPARLSGLKKGLPFPVPGEIQGRFGVARPDGGNWRGIVLRANEGTPVRAIAPGRVVFADWLKGFGNLIIVDHGEKYLSVYAYNQSLLKKVGDTVSGRDVIATVGSTGGQVESGLYFEIRQNGKPVNPLLWLTR